MAVSKGRKKSDDKSEKAVVKETPVVEQVKQKEEPKPVAKPKKEKAVANEPAKSLTFKNKVGDRVSYLGEEWEVLIVVNKKNRERLRIGREGNLRAVWVEDLD